MTATNRKPLGFALTVGANTFAAESPRDVVADAMDEAGRAREAKLLRSRFRVVLDGASVRRAPGESLAHIDAFQGTAESGRVFGFDHRRNNFIEWDLVDGRVVVAEIVPDVMSDAHGSQAATRRDAQKFARRENRKDGGGLAQTIREYGR